MNTITILDNNPNIVMVILIGIALFAILCTTIHIFLDLKYKKELIEIKRLAEKEKENQDE